jgi:hypothetical protein
MDFNQRVNRFSNFMPKISMTAVILATFLIIVPGPSSSAEATADRDFGRQAD